MYKRLKYLIIITLTTLAITGCRIDETAFLTGVAKGLNDQLDGNTSSSSSISSSISQGYCKKWLRTKYQLICID